MIAPFMDLFSVKADGEYTFHPVSLHVTSFQ